MTEKDLIDLGFTKEPYGTEYCYYFNIYDDSDGLYRLDTYYDDMVDGEDDWFVMFNTTTNYKMYDKEDVKELIELLYRTHESKSKRNYKLKKLLVD